MEILRQDNDNSSQWLFTFKNIQKKKRKDDTKNEIKMVIKMLSNITNIQAFPFYFLLYLFYNYKAAYFFMLWIQQDILTNYLTLTCK